MRKLLLTTQPIKPRKRPAGGQTKKPAAEPLFEEETTYEEVVELQQQVSLAKKRMLEAREYMLAAKAETNVAKKVKMEAENHNLTLETLKLKYLLGDLNVDFSGGGGVKTEREETNDNDDEEEEIEM